MPKNRDRNLFVSSLLLLTPDPLKTWEKGGIPPLRDGKVHRSLKRGGQLPVFPYCGACMVRQNYLIIESDEIGQFDQDWLQRRV